MSPLDLATETGQSQAAVRKILPRMLSSGAVEKERHGRYRLPKTCPSGPDVTILSETPENGVFRPDELGQSLQEPCPNSAEVSQSAQRQSPTIGTL
jgi:hypothetical protein